MVKETKRAMEARHVEKMAKAWARRWDDNWVGAVHKDEARTDYRKLRAAVYAVVPGKQKAANIGALLDQAVTAVCRVIRRGGAK